MRKDSMALATMGFAFVLVLLVGWAFYRTLQVDAGQPGRMTNAPEKAVMAQAREVERTRLEALAENGQVAVGMSARQVRHALGEPGRVEQTERNGEPRVVWWYAKDGWTAVVFDGEGRVEKIEKQP